MATHEQETFMATYEWASDWQDLPWAHDEPTLFLANVCEVRQPGRALDIGCGAGTDSVFLAGRGWDVTSLDFVPRALEYTQQRAAAAGVSVTPVEADITTWEPDGTYDLILDHGLLHNMDPVRYPAYRDTVMKAMADDGVFVLLHWTQLFAGQTPQGKMGPRRVSREDIKTFFAPDLQERFYAREEFEDLPDMVGGGMGQAYYWFNRNGVHADPRRLLDQVRATLKRHDVDPDTDVGDGGVTDSLLARLIGPGRFGIRHEEPEPGEVAAILDDFASHAGEPRARIENLFRNFASESHGNICIANARCTECDVHLCKRLRYR